MKAFKYLCVFSILLCFTNLAMANGHELSPAFIVPIKDALATNDEPLLPNKIYIYYAVGTVNVECKAGTYNEPHKFRIPGAGNGPAWETTANKITLTPANAAPAGVIVFNSEWRGPADVSCKYVEAK